MPFENLNTDPDSAEVVIRYIFAPGHFAATTGRVKPKAFEPAQDNQASVFRTVGLADHEIWDLGREHVEPVRGRPSLARADIPIQNVSALGLRVERLEPPPRHANITNWPDTKDAKMSKALQLAADAMLIVRS